MIGKDNTPDLRRQDILLLTGLFLLALALYRPALDFDFTNWDDPLYVTRNPLIQSLSMNRLSRIFNFSTSVAANYHPVTLISFAVQYAAFDKLPSGYHLAGILLHALNGVLVVLVVLVLGWSRPVAVLAAAGFLIHPLQVESVAWISSQKTLVSAFFSLLCLLFYIFFIRGRAKKFYLFSLAAYGLAVFSKPTAVALPVMLYALHRGWGGADRPRALAAAAPFGCLAMVQAMAVYHAHIMEEALGVLSGGSIWTHSVLPLWSLFIYARKILFPYDLLPLYPPLQDVSWSNPAYAFPALITLLVLTFVFLFRKRYRTLAGLVFFYIVTLLPTMNLIPLSVPYADRYLYLPILAPLLLISMGMERGWKRWYFLGRIFLVVSLGAFALGLIRTTLSEMMNWKNSEILWISVLKKKPDHALAHVKLGDYYYEKGHIDRAVAWVSRAVALGLRNPVFAKNLIVMHFQKGDMDKARQSALECIRAYPNDSRFYVQLGRIEAKTNPGQAEAYFKKASEWDPKSSDAWYEWGLFELTAREDPIKAYPYFLKSVQLDPYNPDYHIAVADCFSRTGHYDEAVAALRHALSIDADSADAWYNLGRLLEFQGDQEGSRAALEKARQLNPDLDASSRGPSG